MGFIYHFTPFLYIDINYIKIRKLNIHYISMEKYIKLTEEQNTKYNAWNEHLNNTRERTNYSLRRMDLLIISICGAGIYIIFETLREFKTGEIGIENDNILIATGIFFLLAITINFISQITGYHANNNEEKFIIMELDKIQERKINEQEQKSLNANVTSYDSWTSILNIASIGLMFLGLIFLAIFNYKLL